MLGNRVNKNSAAFVGGEYMKIYIAGQYLPKTNINNAQHNIHEVIRLTNLNVRKAIQTGIILMKKGHFVYIPHLTHFVHIESDIEFPQQYWYKTDIEWLKLCDAIFMLPGWEYSTGARKEKEIAEQLKLKVYYSEEEIESLSE